MNILVITNLYPREHKENVRKKKFIIYKVMINE